MHPNLRNSIFDKILQDLAIGDRKMVRSPVCVYPHRACISILLVLGVGGD